MGIIVHSPQTGIVIIGGRTLPLPGSGKVRDSSIFPKGGGYAEGALRIPSGYGFHHIIVPIINPNGAGVIHPD
jgi:hypothetical protein